MKILVILIMGNVPAKQTLKAPSVTHAPLVSTTSRLAQVVGGADLIA